MGSESVFTCCLMLHIPLRRPRGGGLDSGENCRYRPIRNMSIFSVVGLTLNDISSGALPQVRLAKVLSARGNPPEQKQGVVIYTTFFSNDTQGLNTRAKYKEQGSFVAFLYFSEAAVQACRELGIPLRIVDQLEEQQLPADKIAVLDS